MFYCEKQIADHGLQHLSKQAQSAHNPQNGHKNGNVGVFTGVPEMPLIFPGGRGTLLS